MRWAHTFLRLCHKTHRKIGFDHSLRIICKCAECVDFTSSMIDEEIDEDMAFTPKDMEKWAHVEDLVSHIHETDQHYSRRHSRRNLGLQDPGFNDDCLELGLHDLLSGESDNVVSNSGSLPLPVDSVDEVRIERSIARSATIEELQKWNSIVAYNHRSPHVTFNGLNEPSPIVATSSTSDLVAKFTPSSSFEKDLHNLRDLISKGEMGSAPLSAKDSVELVRSVREQQAKVARLKSKLFHEQIRAQRVKKIKSKSFRKRRKRVNDNDLTIEGSVDIPEDVREDFERQRAIGRMELKKKSTSKWIKQSLKYSGIDNESTADAIRRQTQRDEQLQLKMASMKDNFDADDDLELLEDIARDKSSTEDTLDKEEGIWGMSFMKRATEKKQDEARLILNAMREDSLVDKVTMVTPVIKGSRESHQVEATSSISESRAHTLESRSTYSDDINPWMQAGSERGKDINHKVRKARARHEATIDVSNPIEPAPQDENDPAEFNLLGSNSSDQKALIHEAFTSAGLEEKEFIEEDLIDTPVNTTSQCIPGWGSWGGEGFTVTRKHIDSSKENPSKKRNATQAQINAKKDKKLAKYQLRHTPHPYASKKLYDRSLDIPLGGEWNTLTEHTKLTRPRISTKAGKIIEPLTWESAQQMCGFRDKK